MLLPEGLGTGRCLARVGDGAQHRCSPIIAAALLIVMDPPGDSLKRRGTTAVVKVWAMGRAKRVGGHSVCAGREKINKDLTRVAWLR